MDVAYALIASEAIVYLTVIAFGYTAHTEVQSDLPLVIGQSHALSLGCQMRCILKVLIIQFDISLFGELRLDEGTWLGFGSIYRGNEFLSMQALPTESTALQAYVITTMRAVEVPSTTVTFPAEIHPEPHHLKLRLIPNHPIHIFYLLVRSKYRDY
jgi:hypothetical protein